jgi:N utilization substance protein A
LNAIQGFEPELVDELQTRANAYLVSKQEEFNKLVKELQIDSSLKDFNEITDDQKVELAKKGIKSRDDLADLSTEELLAIFPEMEENEINRIIMKAREIWFENEGDNQ